MKHKLRSFITTILTRRKLRNLITAAYGAMLVRRKPVDLARKLRRLVTLAYSSLVARRKLRGLVDVAHDAMLARALGSCLVHGVVLEWDGRCPVSGQWPTWCRHPLRQDDSTVDVPRAP